MRLAAALTLLAIAGVPLAAQIVPDEFPDQTPMGERVQQDLIERYRPFLSGLYSEATVASGPVVGVPALHGSATVEGGYRFDSGNAVAIVASARSPLGVETVDGDLDPLTGSLGVQAAFALRRVSPSALAQRAELGVGMGASFYQGRTVAAVELTPRIAFPLTPTLSVPVGVRLSQTLGDGRGPFVGLSIGLRRIWADQARMVLE